jgi:tricorn protease interacting factor F2/3
VTEGGTREDAVGCARCLIENILSWLPWQPAAREPQATALLRDQILWHAALYGSQAATAWMTEQFFRLMHGNPVHPDIARSLMQAGALTGDDATFDWFCRKLDASQSEHERLNILTAMGCFSKPTLLEKVRRYILEEVASRNKYLPISVMAANPHATTAMWPWLVENLTAIESFPPVHLERVIASIVPVCGMAYERQVRSFFEAYLKKNNKVKDTVSLSLEKLDINLRMRHGDL